MRSRTLDIYADADPDAKKAAVSKVQDCFDMDMDAVFGGTMGQAQSQATPSITFTVEQLEAMLAQARKQQNGGEAA